MLGKVCAKKGWIRLLYWLSKAGVPPEVNLRNPLHAGEEAQTEASILGFETQDRRHHKSATSLRDTCGHTKRININVIQIKETKKPYGIALGSR